MYEIASVYTEYAQHHLALTEANLHMHTSWHVSPLHLIIYESVSLLRMHANVQLHRARMHVRLAHLQS